MIQTPILYTADPLFHSQNVSINSVAFALYARLAIKATGAPSSPKSWGPRRGHICQDVGEEIQLSQTAYCMHLSDICTKENL